MNFKPRQIVCLEHKNTRLYSEVIQVVTKRQLCWVRPLMLVVLPNETRYLAEQEQLFDLRLTADLLWPESWFRPAFDTEVFSLVTPLHTLDFQSEDPQNARGRLNHFVNQVWQERKQSFPDSE